MSMLKMVKGKGEKAHEIHCIEANKKHFEGLGYSVVAEEEKKKEAPAKPAKPS